MEGWQILDAIAKTPEGGRQRVNGSFVFAANHPATNMWRGHEWALFNYLACVRVECQNRGYDVEKVQNKLNTTWRENGPVWGTDPALPAWFNDANDRALVLMTHRWNLFWKNREWFSAYETEGNMSRLELLDLVCCPDKVIKWLDGNDAAHKPYYYPTHMED